MLEEDAASRKYGPHLAKGFRKGVLGSVFAFYVSGWVALGCPEFLSEGIYWELRGRRLPICVRRKKRWSRTIRRANIAMIRFGLGLDCESAAE
eukprot:scaffold257121_cov34-Prasinocladus_malaysianus.AAC.1